MVPEHWLGLKEAKMFKINKKTEYALISLRHILHKEEGRLTSAKEITETYGTPFDATSRVLQVLASKSWLISEQGAHGGYKLAKGLQELSMKELCEIIEGKQAIVKCLKVGKDVKCDLQSTCNLIQPLSNLNNMLVGFLEEVKVWDLIKEKPSLSEQRMNFNKETSL